MSNRTIHIDNANWPEWVSQLVATILFTALLLGFIDIVAGVVHAIQFLASLV